ncbi:MAG: SprT family zinc-dependent metalloprotease [Balneolaceae bacterium]
MNIRVYPAKKEVRISAPYYLRMSAVETFAASKLPWIQKHLVNFKTRPPIPKLKFETGESHLVWGRKFELKVVEWNSSPKVMLHQNGILELHVRRGSNQQKRGAVLKEWYRAEIKKEIPKLIEKWEGPIGVSVKEFGVKQMKTRWGTCNIRDGRIWLNLELAKKSPDCLEYVVVHEMTHLLERLHNKRFHGFMNQFLPNWRETQKKMNGRID